MPCKNHPQVTVDLKPCSRCKQSFCPDCVVELKGQFYCADCKAEQVKDIQSGADSTELELATIGRRFAAQFIDGLVVALPVGAIYAGLLFGVPGLLMEMGSNIVVRILVG